MILEQKTRLLAFTLMFSAALCAYSSPVDVESARAEAVNVFAKRFPASSLSRAKGMAPQLAYTAEAESTGTPLFYVFNYAGDCGYSIISADDRAVSLLGYSLNGRFDESNLPCNMRWWLSTYAEQISRLDDCSAADVGPKYSRKDRKRIAPLVTTKWNQGEPYNNLCPTDNSTGQRSVTGCVATAMAQVMKSYNWPPESHGSRNGHNFEGIVFDWNNMIDDYERVGYSSEEADAVATLMSACGYSVDMKYASTGSGTQSNLVGPAWIQYFDYDASLQTLLRDYYSLSEWEDIVYGEIADSRPIYYSGASAEGGHAFVCDGYESDGYFHFNWGWGGYQDGYFLLYSLDPASGGIGSFDGGYNSGQEIIANVRKRGEGKQEWQTLLAGLGEIYGSVEDEGDVIDIVFKEDKDGYGMIYNPLAYTQTFDTGISLTPAEGGVKEYYKIFDSMSLDPYYGFGDFSLGFPQEVADGTYLMGIAIMAEGSDKWTDVPMPYGTRQHIVVTKSDGKLSVSNPEINSGELMIASIESASSTPAAGKEANMFVIRLLNTGDTDFYGSISLSIMRNEGVFAEGYDSSNLTFVPARESAVVIVNTDYPFKEGLHTVSIKAANGKVSGEPIVLDFRKRENMESTDLRGALYIDQTGFNVTGQDFLFPVTLNYGEYGNLGISLCNSQGEIAYSFSGGDMWAGNNKRINYSFGASLFDPPLTPGEYFWRMSLRLNSGEEILLGPLWPVRFVSEQRQIVLSNGEKLNYRIYDSKEGIAMVEASDVKGEVEIPESIEGCSTIILRGDAFTFNSDITTLTLPASVKELGNGQFYDMTSLVRVELKNKKAPSATDFTFNPAVVEDIELVVPYGCANEYKRAHGWDGFRFPCWNIIVGDGISVVNGLDTDGGTGAPYTPYYVNRGESLKFGVTPKDGYSAKVSYSVGDGETINADDISDVVLPALTDTDGRLDIYGVEAGGLNSIFTKENVHADIYTPSGILVRRDATREDAESLPAGLYIMGGKKIMIR